ncbi:MAG: sporulation protein YtfJ [Clostridia bacterium]|nr:sporulation protein YtfJ [Clostridia bacterium]MBO7250557.1 sporulation protein YtfJ [Clostridia bacterium]
MATEHKIPEIIKTSLDSVRSLVDANTIVGEPILTQNGTTIIPISKVSVGIATGGVDYNSKKEDRPRPLNFGGGGGTGLTVSPVGFLVVEPDGEVGFINVGQKGKPDPVDQIADFVERTPDIIEKIKNIFSKEPKETV